MTKVAHNCAAALGLCSLSDDEVLIALTHTSDAELAAVACVNRKLLTLAVSERKEREAAKRRAQAIARREQRLAKQRFAAYESDARLVCTVIRRARPHGSQTQRRAVAEGKRLLTRDRLPRLAQT